MFTGLVETVGAVQDVFRRSTKGLYVYVSAPFGDIKVGDSICVSGVCVTVADMRSGQFGFFVSSETLRRSKFSSVSSGTYVNLERSLRAGDRFGGHIVQGHVDEVGRVRSVERIGEESEVSVITSGKWDSLIVEKGSIAVDGISLTVARCCPKMFSVSVIPHTAERTTLERLRSGDPVNLEFDVVAKYIAKGLELYLPEGIRKRLKGELDVDFLRSHGFV